LFWNYTPPVTNESNQQFFTRERAALAFGHVRVLVKNLPPGAYQLNVYRVGYRFNDVYTAYLKLGSPSNLSRAQVRALAEQNDGRAIITERARVTAGHPFVYDVLLSENEAHLILLKRQAAR
jgi:xylan 1,4-beta-xylosidase